MLEQAPSLLPRPVRPLKLAMIAGEVSGDLLGAGLLAELKRRGVVFEVLGVAGAAMQEQGVVSLFPMADLNVMGVGAVVHRLPLLLRRIRQTAAAIIAWQPDLLLTIDSPDFCKRVAKKVHSQAPHLTIMHWVCPSVWAWRPGRAKAMRAYIDHILCLLPFEPQVLRDLGGSLGHYVGHPLVEEAQNLMPTGGRFWPKREEEPIKERQIDEGQIDQSRASEACALLLPGSRVSEIERHLPLLLESVKMLADEGVRPRWILPTLPHLEERIRAKIATSAVEIELVSGKDAKKAAFRAAHVALAASGTVTLELALARLPYVAFYRVAWWEATIFRHFFMRIPLLTLPNIILGREAAPELLQENATPAALAKAIKALLLEPKKWQDQKLAFDSLENTLRLPQGEVTASRVADLVLEAARKPKYLPLVNERG